MPYFLAGSILDPLLPLHLLRNGLLPSVCSLSVVPFHTPSRNALTYRLNAVSNLLRSMCPGRCARRKPRNDVTGGGRTPVSPTSPSFSSSACWVSGWYSERSGICRSPLPALEVRAREEGEKIQMAGVWSRSSRTRSTGVSSCGPGAPVADRCRVGRAAHTSLALAFLLASPSANWARGERQR